MTTTAVHAQTIQPAPRLVVNITIDQLRTDHLEKYSPLYGSNGFKKLLQKGIVYQSASYTFTPIDRASAITAIMTGTTPYYNGIVGAQWLDRGSLRPVRCVTDSPENILSSTITDELKVCTDGRAMVYSIAGDSETAILSAGHAADAALWIDNNSKRWKYSNYYSAKEPKWLTAYNRLNTTSTSASTNDNITKMALQCIDSNGMGNDETSDILSVAYRTANNEGAYLDVDRNISELITKIENKLGTARVMFVVTGTGCCDEQPGDYNKYRIPTGTFYINRTANLLNMYLGAIYGQGRYVETCFRNQIYLNLKLLEQRRLSVNDILNRSQAFLIQNAGVRNVYTSESLLLQNSAKEQIRNGYNPLLCGDILIEVAPGWTLYNEDSQERYQQLSPFIPFPVIIYGGGLKAERINTPVTVDRIAPTIAKSIRIRAPNACWASPLF